MKLVEEMKDYLVGVFGDKLTFQLGKNSDYHALTQDGKFLFTIYYDFGAICFRFNDDWSFKYNERTKNAIMFRIAEYVNGKR